MPSNLQRVLIVDDDALVADTLSLIFEKSGFSSCVSYSTDQALLCAREFHPDLLLCDISMPGRDGLALVHDMTRELPSCHILVLTGFYGNLHRVKQLARRLARPVGILTKPCPPGDLLREASAMLAG
ncbi:MAG TPA: response regulator [Edaphobacter sp.]|nr:response regulator [Edaphobacter sp.]